MNPYRESPFRENPNRNSDKTENWNLLENLADEPKTPFNVSTDTGRPVEYLSATDTEITQKHDNDVAFSFRNGQAKFSSNHMHETYDCISQNQQGDDVGNAIIDRTPVYSKRSYAPKVDPSITGHNFVPQMGDRVLMNPIIDNDETGDEDEEEDENDEDYVETQSDILRSAKTTEKSSPTHLAGNSMLSKPMSGRVSGLIESTSEPNFTVVPRASSSNVDSQSQLLTRSHYPPPHISNSNQQRYNVEPNSQTAHYFAPKMSTTEVSPQFTHAMNKSHGITTDGTVQNEQYNEVGDLSAHKHIYSHVSQDSGVHIAERLTLMDEGDDSSSSRLSFRVGKLPKRKTKKYNTRMTVSLPTNNKSLRDRDQSHSPSSVLNDERLHHAALDHWTTARSNASGFQNSALRDNGTVHYAEIQDQPQSGCHRLPQYMYEAGAVQKPVPTHGDSNKIVHHQRHMISNEQTGAYPDYETFSPWHEQQPPRFYDPVTPVPHSQRLQGSYESSGIPMDPHYHYVYPYSHGVFSQMPVENYFQPASRHEDQQAQAELNIVGNLRHMSRGWNEREIKAGRRLVAFQRIQKGVRVDLHFKAIDPKDYNSDICAISCILRKNSDEFYVTSVDCIALLELIIDQKFSVEEKNRIRRNLEVCRPITVSKSKPGLEDFFRQIMTFGSPRPRNIEKDVKVMLWENLENALQKIVAKYSASWSTND